MSSKLARLGTAATSTMTVVVESVGVLMQVALIAVGLEFIFAFDDDTQFGALILGLSDQPGDHFITVHDLFLCFSTRVGATPARSPTRPPIG